MQADTARADTVRGLPELANRAKPPASPKGAAIRSLLLPGFGQFTLKKPVLGAVFVAVEVGMLSQVIRYNKQFQDRRAEVQSFRPGTLPAGPGRDSVFADSVSADSAARVASAKREDWIVYAVVNHVLSALEAYISAHFWDFPKELRVYALPRGVAGSMSLPFRIR